MGGGMERDRAEQKPTINSFNPHDLVARSHPLLSRSDCPLDELIVFHVPVIAIFPFPKSSHL